MGRNDPVNRSDGLCSMNAAGPFLILPFHAFFMTGP